MTSKESRDSYGYYSSDKSSTYAYENIFHQVVPHTNMYLVDSYM